MVKTLEKSTIENSNGDLDAVIMSSRHSKYRSSKTPPTVIVGEVSKTIDEYDSYDLNQRYKMNINENIDKNSSSNSKRVLENGNFPQNLKIDMLENNFNYNEIR